MADTETWQDEGDFEAPVQVLETTVVAQTAELPDIKLFGKWNCDDVQVSDMSLQVSFPRHDCRLLTRPTCFAR